MSMGERGHTLYLVMIILTVIGIFSTVLFRYSSQAPVQGRKLLSQREAYYLSESGIQRVEYFLNGSDGKDLTWESDLFTEIIPDYGTILLSCKQWGLKKRVISTGERKGQSHTSRALISRTLPGNLGPSVTLTGSIGGLVIDFQTKIGNGVVLNHGSVRKGKYKERIPGSENWTTIRESDSLPFEKELIDEQFNHFHTLWRLSAKAEPENRVITSGTGLHDTVYVNGDCQINSGSLYNKTVVVSGRFSLGREASMELCEVVAGDIESISGKSSSSVFWSGKRLNIISGEHDSQFFSDESLLLKGGEFDNSSLFLCSYSPTDSSKSYGINVKKGDYRGTCISIADSGNGTIRKPALFFEPGVSFTGTAISNGDISLKECSITGSLWARSLVTEEKGVTYKNWLFRTKVMKSSDALPFPLLGKRPVSLLRKELK